MIVMEYLDSRNVTLLNSVDDPWELSDIKVHLIFDFFIQHYISECLGCTA